MNANTSHDANAVACDVDNTINRALSALRDAQPRSGSEMFAGRILAHIEHRTAAPRPARFHLSAHMALWTAASAALLSIASLIILHRPVAPPSTRGGVPAELARWGGKRQGGVESPHVSVERTSSLGRHPERSATARSRRTPVFENCWHQHHQGCAIHDDNVVMGGIATTPTDAQALADLHAPSHPAPPFPLTPQEKLFLRMLRYGDATQLAELNPMVRAKQDADETTAFKAFFPDPPPLQQPTGDTE
jgi:hypothetical protein